MVTKSVLLGGVLAQRVRSHRRDRWTPEQLGAYRARALTSLLAHARTRSAFYRTHHRGLNGAALSQLPPVTKDELMSHWDDLVTAQDVSLEQVQKHLDDLQRLDEDPGTPWRGCWWAAATAGSTGRRAVFVWNRREWTQILTSYARVNDWARVPVGVRHPLRTAVVSSRNPTHQSAVVGASLRSRLVPTVRLDAAAPVEDTAQQLNRFAPRLLVAYASMLEPLASAQLRGTLRIAPEKVISASERLTGPARAAAGQAWGVPVVDTYAATETAAIASPCLRGSMHLYEDFLIIEPVDQAYRPVPDGNSADRLLVTVLFSRTVPLIRYELTDSVRLSSTGCPCGLPFRVLARVEGRTEDTLTLRDAAGRPVRVHPNVLHAALDELAVRGWQVHQTPEGLTVLLVDPDGSVDLARVSDQVGAQLARVGATSPVAVRRTQHLVRTPLGKAPLVQAWRGESGHGDARCARSSAVVPGCPPVRARGRWCLR